MCLSLECKMFLSKQKGILRSFLLPDFRQNLAICFNIQIYKIVKYIVENKGDNPCILTEPLEIQKRELSLEAKFIQQAV